MRVWVVTVTATPACFNVRELFELYFVGPEAKHRPAIHMLITCLSYSGQGTGGTGFINEPAPARLCPPQKDMDQGSFSSSSTFTEM